MLILLKRFYIVICRVFYELVADGADDGLDVVEGLVETLGATVEALATTELFWIDKLSDATNPSKLLKFDSIITI